MVVRKLNRRWARVKVPGCGWVRFRLTRAGLPVAKTFRVTSRNNKWHIGFAVTPEPAEASGTDSIVGIGRGVTITAAPSDGRKPNRPQLTIRVRTRVRTRRLSTGRPERQCRPA